MNPKKLLLPSLLFSPLAFLWWAGPKLEQFLNRVQPEPLPEVTPRARQLHQSALVIDLHADSLLFGRNLLRRSKVGHIDLPRLQEGNVAIQVQAAATRVPMGANETRTDPNRPDLLTLAGLAQRKPTARLTPFKRALYHVQRMAAIAAQSGGQWWLLRNQGELAQFLVQRAERPYLVGTILTIEGTQALDGDPANIHPLYAAGFRILGLTHFYDTEFAGSAHGLEQGGLTPLGRQLVDSATQLEMLMDVAHLSRRAIDDVLALTDRPILASHGGVRGTCDNPRNLADDQVRAIAATGGVVGIGYWETAVNGRHPRHIIAAIEHVINLVGDNHVALGSDFDGGITTAFDTSQLAVLTQQMLNTGFSETTIRKILGGNALRLLQKTLPI